MTFDLSDDARKFLALSQEEAQRLSHDLIGTEHILLALLDESFPSIRRLLESCHISAEDVASKVDAAVRPGSSNAHQLPFTHLGKRVFELSMEEASRVGSVTVDVTHHFVALVLEQKGIGGQVLRELGLTPDVVRHSLSGKKEQ